MAIEINAMQALVDGMSAAWQKERAESQMTLGALIATLEQLPHDRPVIGLGEIGSYRGYYCDLAFLPSDVVVSVGYLMFCCQDVMGKALRGYKGGEFVMGQNTPCWVASYGSTGERLIGLDLTSEIIAPVTAREEE